jgi:selenide,water dikinase
MGGQPITALNIVAFPTADLPLAILTDILRGGQEKVHEAGALIVGGHTVIDTELKYGLAVTGKAHPKFLLTNAAAKPGDVLVLTKPIGNGILATALKRGIIPASAGTAMIEMMKKLNGAASRAALASGVKCATDITGFGLLGHASHIARASNVTLDIHARSVPVLDGARDALKRGASTDGLKRNAEYVKEFVEFRGNAGEDRDLLCDPQTSGGLLVAVPSERVANYLSKVEGAVVIGEVLERENIAIVVD